MSSTLELETLVYDTAGLPCSARYSDRYTCRAGALGQARHVFLAGNGLPRRWAGQRQFVIVETGFGLGNNFLACWQAWREDPARPGQLHFVSVEKHPLRPEDLAQSAGSAQQATTGAGADLGQDGLQQLRAALLAQWPLPLKGLHRLRFESGRVILTLALGDARELVPQLALGADAFFLDGFAPERNPQMWEPGLLRALARLARPGATLATYSAAGTLRDALGAQGFDVQRQSGFGVKRHMLSGQFAPRWKMRRHEPPAAHAGERHAVIVGAGLAGCATALALARRGWRITLLDRGAEPAAGASGLPAGLVYPLLSADDNLASRLSRAAYTYALTALAEAATVDGLPEPISRSCGVFQQALDAEEDATLRTRLQHQGWPQAFARYADADTAFALLGSRPQRGGIWFPAGTAVHGGRWCAAMLHQAQLAAAQTGGALDLHWNCEIAQVCSEGGRWVARAQDGAEHAAPVLVLANAAGLGLIASAAHLPLQALAGELTLLDTPALSQLRAALGGDGYAIPPVLGTAVVGATYETAANSKVVTAPGTRAPMATAARATGTGAAAPDPAAMGTTGPEATAADSTTANLLRLQQLLAQAPTVRVQGSFRAHRCVSQDRLPIVGALCDEQRVLDQPRNYTGAHLADLPRQPGLYGLAGLGSRGLTLAPLLGELLATLITGEPAPLESALCDAVDPARYLLRHLRAAPSGSAPE